MEILDIAIITFIILESANVFILYFMPDSKKGNGVAVFKFWQKSKLDDEAHLFVQYMTKWVAGTKLVFIGLLLVILLNGDQTLKLYSAIIMTLSIASYYFRLHPIITQLDRLDLVIPKGYSKTLGFMIASFMSMFIVAIMVCFLQRS